MGDRLLPGTFHRITEFIFDPYQQKWLTGDCGPNALTMAEEYLKHRVVTTDAIAQTVERMRTWGGASDSGVTTGANLETQAKRDGFTIQADLPWNDYSHYQWRPFFETWAGRLPLVYVTNNGQALIDWKTGKGENATNLQGHVLAVVGRHINDGPQDKMPSGFYCADGDNFDEGDVLQFYPDAVIEASNPGCAFALQGNTMLSNTRFSLGVPTGWKDANGALTAPNGHVLTFGFRQRALEGWDPSNLPLNDAYGVGPNHTRQDFLYGSLEWTAEKGVYESPIGEDYQHQLAATKTYQDTLSKVLTALVGAEDLLKKSA